MCPSIKLISFHLPRTDLRLRPSSNAELRMTRPKMQFWTTHTCRVQPLIPQFTIYSSSIYEKVNVCPTVDLNTFYPSGTDGQNVFVDPNLVGRTQLI